MLDIETLAGPRKTYPESSQVSFLSLNDYINIAKRIITHFGCKYSSSMVQQMLASDDTIANIAHHIMKADWGWNPSYVGKNGKPMNRRAYRYYCAYNAMKTYMKRSKKYYDLKDCSLDREFDMNQQLKKTLVDVKNPDPATIVEENETQEQLTSLVNQLLSSGVLSPKQEKFIRLQYLENICPADIARQEGITREAVRQVVERGLAKLRELIR